MRIIAEPGRYYVASAFTLAVNIIAKKLVLKEQIGSDDEEESSERTFLYYVNDGVYGSFNCILYDHAHVKPLLQKVPSECVVYTSGKMAGQNKCKQVCFSVSNVETQTRREVLFIQHLGTDL